MKNINLPKEFVDYTSHLFGRDRWERFLASFEDETPVSVRFNPRKPAQSSFEELLDRQVPWCRNAWYLKERPNFTLDPLLHAGAYYVQEASSMFLDEVLRQLFSIDPSPSNVTSTPPLGGSSMLITSEYVQLGGAVLDLCAAPGGKSTLLRAALPDSCILYSNEPDRRRANILMENIQKQGHPDVVVTNNYARDYQKSGLRFGLILCDVPCSGEGMFRKDEGAIGEWSLQNVMKCAELQRSIIEDIWPCLEEDGIMIYSTCTFNTHEDEENVRWICENLGAELLPIETKPEWNITGSLLEGWNKPVYRFIPGTTKGEGIFMAVLRKTSSSEPSKAKGMLKVMWDGKPVPTQKGKTLIPAHAEALLTSLDHSKYPMAELNLEQAQKYLHHEAIVLDPDVPKGFVVVTYQGNPLGFVKNIGNRANNLYPPEWKIRVL